jgi:N-acyl amino acid synthase of PEP-CTERM/exosortase system
VGARPTLRMSVALGLTHWCAFMEPALLRILRATEIHLEPVGPMVEYHGLRQPCYGNIRTVLSRIRAEQPDVWDLITDGGELWELPTPCEGRRDLRIRP